MNKETERQLKELNEWFAQLNEEEQIIVELNELLNKKWSYRESVMPLNTKHSPQLVLMAIEKRNER